MQGRRVLVCPRPPVPTTENLASEVHERAHAGRMKPYNHVNLQCTLHFHRRMVSHSCYTTLVWCPRFFAVRIFDRRPNRH